MGFLGLCDLVSKKRHKATTPNGVPQVKEHDIFQTELIQWLGSVRNMSCSSCICVIRLVRDATRLLHLTASLRGKALVTVLFANLLFAWFDVLM